MLFRSNRDRIFRVDSLRRSYKMGLLTLHDLHEKNLEAMQSVVHLGQQLGRPIATSLWSSRADLRSAGVGGKDKKALLLIPPPLPVENHCFLTCQTSGHHL